MNLQRARVVLRPRGLLEIFDLSLRFCLSVAGPLYLRLAALVLLPALALCWGVHRWFAGWWVATWIAAVVLVALTRGVFTVAASRLLFEARPSVRSVLGHALRRTPARIVALLSYAVLLALSALGIVLPLVTSALHAFLDEAVLLEQQGPWAALSRARVLLRGRFELGLGLRLGQLAAAALFILASEQLGQALVGFVLQLGEPLGAIGGGGSAFAVAGLLLSAPFLATAEFLAYIDARTRQDGWDIQLRFLALAAAEERP